MAKKDTKRPTKHYIETLKSNNTNLESSISFYTIYSLEERNVKVKFT
jgi:hypothetical protein